jgi:hypothetical protein
MDDDEEQRCYGDSTILEPILEQQDDEVTKFHRKTSFTFEILLDDNISNE